MHRFVFTLAFATLVATLCVTASSGAAKPQEQKVTLAVTDKGFEPASVRVKAGRPVRLVVTRKTDRTCAKEIVVQGYGIQKSLPLNKPVELRFTPKKAGAIRYTCAMDMIAGRLVVQ